jgi:transaldolase
MKIKIFMDGADIDQMMIWSKNPMIKGFTTNPTLMKKSGIKDYKDFALKAVNALPKDKPISFEVFSDNLNDMEEEARIINSWSKNIFVKIPVTNTKGESTASIISKLSNDMIPLNITAVMTMDQVIEIKNALNKECPAIISIFAGRIADTGVDPLPLMMNAVKNCNDKNIEILWASPRELLNVIQADQCGCHIITATPDVLNKLALIGKDLNEYSLETVKMFYNDAIAAGFNIRVSN